MAGINIIKPRYGTIQVLDSSLSHYQVKYVRPADDVEGNVQFHGFKIFCNYCHRYVGTNPDNPATFDVATLEESGHPGPFDISADTSAEVEFCVETEPADPTMGTTTPTVKWIPAQVDHYVEYTIKATPLDGYEFVKWVSSTGNEYTKATNSFSVKVTYAGDHYRHYTAYFRKKTVKVYVRIKGVGVNNNSDSEYPAFSPRGVYTSSSDHTQIAQISPGYIEAVTVGDSFTETMSWLPAAAQYSNAKFLGFKVVQGTNEDGMFFEDSSVTATVDYSARTVIVEAWFSLGVVVTLRFVDPRYVNMGGFGGSARLVRIGSASGSTLSSVGGRSVVDFVNKVIRFVVPLSRAPTSLYMDYYGYWISDARAFLHKTSSPSRCSFGAGTVQIQVGTEDEEYVVYVCTHLLLYDPNQDRLIYGAALKLLYDCSVPPD